MNVAAAGAQAFWLFAGIGVVLLVASAIGQALRAFVARGRPHEVIDNVNARIKGWWLIVLVVGLAFLGGAAGVTLLFLFVAYVALREFVPPARSRSERLAQNVAFAVVLPVQFLLIHVGGDAQFAGFVPLGVLALGAFALTGRGSRLAAVSWTLAGGLTLCVYCISHVLALLRLEIPGYEGRNLLLIAFLVLVVQSSDVAQFVWGKLLGRRPLAPRVSPAKTWEGLIGGVASATALGAALYFITPFAPWQAAIIAFAINLCGFAGGLLMSAIKRRRGVKDWGRLIEGHGGMLDRLDSLVLAAPVFYHWTRIGWT